MFRIVDVYKQTLYCLQSTCRMSTSCCSSLFADQCLSVCAFNGSVDAWGLYSCVTVSMIGSCISHPSCMHDDHRHEVQSISAC